MSKTQSKEALTTKADNNFKNDFINYTYSTKSKKIDDFFKIDKDRSKKINSIVQLYTNNKTLDFKLEGTNSNKNEGLFNSSKNKDNLNLKTKNTFSYNTLFNKNSSAKYFE
jgi:hypothetical protein